MGTTAVAGQPSSSSSRALNAESAIPSTARGASAATCSRASATLAAVCSSHPSVEGLGCDVVVVEDQGLVRPEQELGHR